MKDEPFFLVNAFLEKGRKELEHVLEVVEGKNQKYSDRTVFIRNFTNEMFKAHKITKRPKIEEEKKSISKEKESLLKKKQELIKKLQELQIKKPVEIQHPELTEGKSIILSKETGKALVKTEFNGTKYTVIEPELNENDILLLKELSRAIIDLDNKQKLVGKLKELCNKFSVKYTEEYYDKIRYYAVRDVKKYGKISPLIEDSDVREIVCSNAGTPIIISYKGKEDILTNITLTLDELNNFLQVIAKKANQKTSVENPFLNITIDKLNIQGTISSEFVKPKFVITKI